MAPKKKQVLQLSDFLSLGGEGSSTNWADDSDDIVLPTQPGQYNPDSLPAFKRPQADRGDYGGRGGDSFDSRPPRPDVPFPTAPPYTAYIGNMSFDSNEQDIKDFFEADPNVKTTSVRIVSGYDGKPKGFAYAEFPEADMLRAALELTGSNLGGRNVRISVAEAPKGRDEGRSAGDWTRSGPLPDLPGRGGSGLSSRGPSTPVDSGRDWGDVRGSKFTPSAPASPALGSGRPPMGAGGARPMGSGFRERDPSAGSDADRDWTAARGGRFTPSVPLTPSTSTDRRGFGGMERKTSDNDSRDWRARASPVASPALSDSSSGVAAPAAPVERKKLQLAARSSTSAANDAASPAPTSASTNKPNPFGAAAPVDTAAREQALLDARIEKERAAAEERRQKQEADAAAAAAKKSAPSPFGAAKPVDVSAREKEVEEKLRKEKEDVASATKGMSEAKIAEEKSANPKREWRRPSGPNAGLTDAQASAPQSQVAKQGGGSSTTQGNATKPGAPTPHAPRQIQKNAGLRKEGFSYSNIARGSSSKPPTQPIASDNIVPDNVPIKNASSPAPLADNTAAAENASVKDIKSEATTTGNDSSEHMSKRALTGDSVTEA